MATLGVILVVLGAALVVAEAHLPSHGDRRRLSRLLDESFELLGAGLARVG